MINSYDQTRCPKCGWMFCEGYWKEGVCRADMQFCGEPTADGDEAARCLRIYYEAHREGIYEHSYRKIWQRAADELMLGMINEIGRINVERQRQYYAKHLKEADGKLQQAN